MNDLDRPGAGLPNFERAVLNFTFKTATAFRSDAWALKKFQQEHDELNRLVDDDSYDAFEPLLISRVIGVEDSSRNWSVAMVLDHLCKTNAEMLVAVEALNKGVVPHGEIDISLYKPDPDVGHEVFDRFNAVHDRYVSSLERLFENRKSLLRHPTFAHPWFGELSAHQWHVLAAIHQWIHRRQANKIITMLGLV